MPGAIESEFASQTRRTASLFGFADRGLVAPGPLADLHVIDADKVASEAPEMAYDLPAGGRRLVQRARGYVATIKRGVVVRDHDGRVLYESVNLPADAQRQDSVWRDAVRSGGPASGTAWRPGDRITQDRPIARAPKARFRARWDVSGMPSW